METLLLILPAAGAVTSELLPNRNKIDGAPAAVMATTGLINSAGEELLWRGVFLQEFPHDLLRGRPWAPVGFSLWHLVPQMILPSRLGRRRFMLGAGLIGSVSAFSAWRSGGLRNCLSGFSLSDRFVRSNCRSASLRSHMIENVLEIAAPAEKVFDFIVDVRNEPQWNPQMLHAEMLTPEPIGVGTTFRVRFGRVVGDGLIRDTKINRPRSWAAISRSRGA
ncbi:MAG TPA: CPBP family glutamic-type intramembrane protease [Propionibacteriaceae bacterium]|nr:CPBP family glutamic-type intramembrane protease [Propionibacteriaceae bacterium]